MKEGNCQVPSHKLDRSNLILYREFLIYFRLYTLKIYAIGF